MGTKLLLADDSITIQKVVGIIFASEDYELAIVDNGDAALVKARETTPDVLLVDAVMPGKTGYEVCEEVRRDPLLTGVPILLLTGAFEPFDEEKARQSGADDFISKPFESQHLIDKVTTLADLGKRRKTDAPEPYIAPPPQVAPPAFEKPVPPPSPQLAPVAASVAPTPTAVAGIGSAVPASESQYSVEMVEGTADDDLWGAFELEEVAEGDAGEFGELSLEEEASFATETIEEPYSFAEEPARASQPAAGARKWEAVTEESFGFEEETGAGASEEAPGGQFDFAAETAAPEEFEAAPEDQFDIFEEEAGAAGLEASPGEQFAVFEEEAETAGFETVPGEQFEVFAEEAAPAFVVPPTEAEEFFAELAEPAVVAPSPVSTPPLPIAQEAEFQFAAEEEYMPVAEAAAGTGTPPAAGELSLSDEQLASLISRISRDIIEKIAWEVVPDLAERIIQEEIRKIKEG